MSEQQRRRSQQPRARWSSRAGLVLSAAGSAIGLGMLWKPPFTVGSHGGGAFLLIYFVVLASVGGCVLLAEFAIGRISQRNPIGALGLLGGGFWPWIGIVGIAAAFLSLSICVMAAGRVMTIAATTAVSGFTGDGDDLFRYLAANPIEPIVAAGLFAAVTIAIVIAGVRRGIERASRVLTPLALLMLSGLTLVALSRPGAGQALASFFRPDFNQITGTMVATAVGNALCSLSIGLGTMITYGSYRSASPGLIGDTAAIVGLDVIVVIAAGAAASVLLADAGDGPASGFRLLLVTLPQECSRLPYGSLCRTVFFGLLLVVALLSSVSLLEPIVAYFIDEHGFHRRQIAIAVGVYAFLLGVPSGWSLSPAGDLILLGRPLAGAISFLTADILMPLGGLSAALFVAWVLGRPALPVCFGAGTGDHWICRLWLFLLRGPVPLAILWSLLVGLTS